MKVYIATRYKDNDFITTLTFDALVKALCKKGWVTKDTIVGYAHTSTTIGGLMEKKGYSMETALYNCLAGDCNSVSGVYIKVK